MSEARHKLIVSIAKQYEQNLISKEEYEEQMAIVCAQCVTAQSPLGTYLSEEAQQRRAPWKASERIALETLNGIEKRATESPNTMTSHLLEVFEKKLYDGALSPFEVALCEHLLYHKNMEIGCKIFLSIVLDTLPCDRLRLHNWWMAKGLDLTQKESFGPYIDDLGYPLLPAEFPDLNNRLFQSSGRTRQQSLAGGSTEQLEAAKSKISKIFNLDGEDVFRSQDGLHQPTWSEDEKVLRGGAYKERILDHNGTQQLELEMGETEERLKEIISLLKKQTSQAREAIKQRTSATKYNTNGSQKEVRPPYYPMRGRGRGRHFEGAGFEDADSKNE